jgi:hypothetical protein
VDERKPDPAATRPFRNDEQTDVRDDTTVGQELGADDFALFFGDESGGSAVGCASVYLASTGSGGGPGRCPDRLPVGRCLDLRNELGDDIGRGSGRCRERHALPGPE